MAELQDAVKKFASDLAEKINTFVQDVAELEVKTYTTGRITGLKYDNGVPVLILGDALSVPFSKLIQIRS